MVIIQKIFNSLFVPNSIQVYSNLYLERRRKVMMIQLVHYYVLTILISTVKENYRLLLDIRGNTYAWGFPEEVMFKLKLKDWSVLARWRKMSSREESMPAEGTAYGKDLQQEEAGTGGIERTIQCYWSSESVVNYIYILVIINFLSVPECHHFHWLWDLATWHSLHNGMICVDMTFFMYEL